MNINRIIITGNLVANPTLRNTKSGTQVASATIANNEFYNDGEGERQQVTTFVDVTVWGKPAENFSKLAKKGQEIVIEGRLRCNDWESEDGQKHSKHFVRAETWQFTQYIERYATDALYYVGRAKHCRREAALLRQELAQEQARQRLDDAQTVAA